MKPSVEPETSPREVLDIDRPEQLKALGHPLRLKVLQMLGDSDRPLTNRDLAGLIERAPAGGREKPYRPVAKHLKVGPEIRAAGLASELQSAQLHELQRGFALYAAKGEFRSAQVHTKLDAETVRRLLDELIQKLTDLEDDSQPLQSITIAFHPAIEQGETD
jgi:DNA-binding transcriptional ArsR family regulator